MLKSIRNVCVLLVMVSAVLAILMFCQGEKASESEPTMVTAPVVVHQPEMPAPVVPVIEAMPTEAPVAPESEDYHVVVSVK